jgi:hypothetical protein
MSALGHYHFPVGRDLKVSLSNSDKSYSRGVQDTDLVPPLGNVHCFDIKVNGTLTCCSTLNRSQCLPLATTTKRDITYPKHLSRVMVKWRNASMSLSTS